MARWRHYQPAIWVISVQGFACSAGEGASNLPEQGCAPGEEG